MPASTAYATSPDFATVPDSIPPASVRPNRLLTKARSGRLASTIKINLNDPRVVELACLANPDAIWFCNEHVPNDWCSLENQIRAARIYGVDTIVRVSKGSYSDLLKPFEAGASGIMVPHVASASEARQLVNQTRFFPMGSRPLDGGGIDGRFCRLPVMDYVRHANTDQYLIFQIESPEGVENVEEIAAVSGFDALLFGAGDYAHLIGQCGNLNHPQVIAARKRVGEAASKHGKQAMLASLGAPFETLRKEGYRIFNLSADVVGLGECFTRAVSAFSQVPAEMPLAASPR